MFRIKKGNDGEDTSAAPPPEAAEEVPVAQVPPRRAAPLPGRTMSGPSPPSAPPSAARDKTLVVGKEVRLKGEVLSCDKIVVEGEADVVVAGCRILQIGPTGVFRGSAAVAEGEIAGQFDGDLTASDRLVVRSTGRIKGAVRYSQITIEAGGQITGELKTLDAAGSPGHVGKGVQLPPSLRPAPLARGETIAGPAALEAGAPTDRT